MTAAVLASDRDRSRRRPGRARHGCAERTSGRKGSGRATPAERECAGARSSAFARGRARGVPLDGGAAADRYRQRPPRARLGDRRERARSRARSCRPYQPDHACSRSSMSAAPSRCAPSRSPRSGGAIDEAAEIVAARRSHAPRLRSMPSASWSTTSPSTRRSPRASKNPMFALIVGSFHVVTRQTWPIGWAARATDADRARQRRLPRGDRARAIADATRAVPRTRWPSISTRRVKVLLAAGVN